MVLRGGGFFALDGAYGVAGLPELVEGVANADEDEGPDADEDGGSVLFRELVPKDEDLFAVMDAEPEGNGVPEEAAGGEGHHKGGERHFERAGGEHEGAERHGRRQDRGQGDGKDGVRLHPASDALEDAGRGALFDEIHAAGLAYLVGEIAAEGGAYGGGDEQEGEVLVLGGVEDEQDVGDAGDRQGNKGRIDNGDEEETNVAEADDGVQDVLGKAAGCEKSRGERKERDGVRGETGVHGG